MILKIFIFTTLVTKYQKAQKDFHEFSLLYTQTHTYRKKTPTHPKVHKYLDFEVKRKAISYLIPPFFSGMKIDSQS